MKLYEITTNELGEETDQKLLKTGDLGELESYAENLARSQNIKEIQWSLLGGCLVSDDKMVIDNKRSLYISENKYLLIDKA
ncbi:hypothetical protein G3465_12070 [Shewanella baltica]|uniref:hypothetical protein n=1 Tax=Shewanella baltica TaxID=62322 RepID=UPI00217CC719|nr:hypothetical protein [Shewanella baltica]MCS6153630.1 hypothetical protein [Shewanella baltica]